MFPESFELSRYVFELSWKLSSYLVAEICHHIFQSKKLHVILLLLKMSNMIYTGLKSKYMKK